jgi:hypothetical protein
MQYKSSTPIPDCVGCQKMRMGQMISWSVLSSTILLYDGAKTILDAWTKTGKTVDKLKILSKKGQKTRTKGENESI